MTTSEGARRVDLSPGDDAQLCAFAQAGDEDAFTVLYRRHSEAVWRQAYRMTVSRVAAEDVLAATFLTAWRRIADVRIVDGSARPWLIAVAGNEARTEWRRMHRYSRLTRKYGPAPDVVDHSDAVVSSLDDRRRVHEVLAAIADLPAAQRDAVTLCLVGDVPQADAARALGVPEATLRSRIHRARLRLRSLLPEEVR